jgi:hypothetical protein
LAFSDVPPECIRRFVALSAGRRSDSARAGLVQHSRLGYVLGFQLLGIAEHALRAHDWFLLREFTEESGDVDYWRCDLAPPGRLTAALNYYRGPAPRKQQRRDAASYVDATCRFERVRGADRWLQLTAHQ